MTRSSRLRPSTTVVRLAVLALATFTFVTTETQPVALLAPMAHGLGVSESSIGVLMTVYAGAAAITAIPLTVLAARVDRRRLVMLTMATLVVAQAVLALAPSYPIALVARLLGALAHGVFWSVVAQVAGGLVSRERIGRATAAVFAGNSVALVLGIPLVSALGALVGWRSAAGVMGVVALAVVAAMAMVLPHGIDASAGAAAVGATDTAATDRRALILRALRHRGVLVVSGVTLLLAFAHFAAYTYLSPLVRAHTGLTGTGVSAILFAYGAAGVLGVARLGSLADRRPRAALMTCCVACVIALALISAIAHGTVAMVLAAVIWGAGFTALPIFLQTAILRVAPEMPDTASALYVVAFQIGIGGGALAGAGLLGAGALSAVPVVSLGLFVLGTALAAGAGSTFGGERVASGEGGARDAGGDGHRGPAGVSA